MFISRRILYTIATIFFVAALIASCGGQSPATPGSEQTDAPVEPAAPTEQVAPTAQPPETEFTSPLEQEISPLPTPTDVTTGPVEIVPPEQDTGSGTAPLTGEVPQDLLGAVIDDLLERLEVGREAIAVEEAGAVVWRDGSLGCPQPGMMYTQALVPGYQIILRVGEQTFDYHASERGYFVLCEGGLAQEPLPPGEGGGPLVDQ